MAEYDAEVARIEGLLLKLIRGLRVLEKRVTLHEQAILEIAAALREEGIELEVVGSLPSASEFRPSSPAAARSTIPPWRSTGTSSRDKSESSGTSRAPRPERT